jgi:NAD+ synthase
MDTTQVRAIIADHFRKTLKTLHRDGFVVGLSGGIDSTLTAHLAVEAMGPEKVLGVVMPERESSPESRALGMDLVRQLGIKHEEVDLTSHLEALGAYEKRDKVVRRYLESYTPGRHRVGIALRQDLIGSSLPPLHYLTVEDENGTMLLEERIRLRDYTELVAATNFKQRSRAMQLYYFADHYNYAVLGTTNRDELLLGFFVKLGDGAADVEGIEGLYKSELYVLAKAMGVDQRVIDRTPTTDTLPGQKSQKGYFYGLDFTTLDTALQVMEGLVTLSQAAERTGLGEAQIKQLVDNLKRRHETTTILRAPPTGIGRAPLAHLL